MLRIARLTDHGGRYYLADLAVEIGAESVAAGRSAADPGRDGTSGGRWSGLGSPGLGLGGPVEEAAFRALLSGRHPRTGAPLRHHGGTVSGYDCTFAAPKSLSVLFALGTPETAAAILTAHHAAVEGALSYVGKHAAAVRRSGSGALGVEPVRGVIAASFTHGVSRALDPHLHTHAVVVNVAQGVDGRWSTLDARGLFAHARAAGALYDAAVRLETTERTGAAWAHRTSGGYELASVDPTLVGLFSSRQAEIRSLVAERGAARSARARSMAWAATRDDKTVVRTAQALRARWAAMARDAGSDAGMNGWGSQSAPATPDIDEHRFAAALLGAGERAVRRREAVAAWAGAIAPGARADAVGHCVDALTEWSDDVGVAERRRPPSAVVPPPHLLRTLGPRPSAPQSFASWQTAARAIERYRARWNVDDRLQSLGAGECAAELAAFPARRLAEHVALTRSVDDVLERLGRGRRAGRALDVGAARTLGR